MRRPRNGIFDLLAPVYDRLAGSYGLRHLLDDLGPLEGVRLLDLGGGTGRLAARGAARGARAVVVDPSAGMVARARGKGLPALRAQAERLPLKDATFDLVVIVDALHHMTDLPGSAREVARVLEPGGQVILLEPDPERFAGRWVARFERWAGMGSLLLPGAALANLFAVAGLDPCVRHIPLHLLVVARKPGSAGPG